MLVLNVPIVFTVTIYNFTELELNGITEVLLVGYTDI